MQITPYVFNDMVCTKQQEYAMWVETHSFFLFVMVRFMANETQHVSYSTKCIFERVLVHDIPCVAVFMALSFYKFLSADFKIVTEKSK